MKEGAGRSDVPKFAANLSTLFCELPFLDRFEAAAAAGFRAVECQFPYRYETDQIAEQLRALELSLVLLNLPAGDLASGDIGIAVDRGRVPECREAIDQGLAYAATLECPMVHLLSGRLGPEIDSKSAIETYVEHLRYAAEQSADQGLKILVEPFNATDVPGYLVSSADQASDIIERAGSIRVGLQFDFYHAQMTHGDLAESFRRHLDKISHIQISGVPGRHEPDSGEINYPFLFDLVDTSGYEGYIGCEYHPAESTLKGLGWLEPYRPL
jgi:hydroxypyruvate isomerase